jgi:hypothetical protein
MTELLKFAGEHPFLTGVAIIVIGDTIVHIVDRIAG